MRQFYRREVQSNEMSKLIASHHPGNRAQKKDYGKLEKILLGLMVACMLIVVVLYILG